jgi:hypothetical protein
MGSPMGIKPLEGQSPSDGIKTFFELTESFFIALDREGELKY